MRADDHLTVGDYETERHAEEAFDAAVNTKHWTIHREVQGRSNAPNVFSNDTVNVRIDRVLVPTPELNELGWWLGPVGVEIKKSGEKIGPPICQIRDYSHCVFRLDLGSGPHYTVLRNIFLFPALAPSGAVLSILTAERIGFASIGRFYSREGLSFTRAGDALSFYLAGQRVYCSVEGPRIQSAMRSGVKHGSR